MCLVGLRGTSRSNCCIVIVIDNLLALGARLGAYDYCGCCNSGFLFLDVVQCCMADRWYVVQTLPRMEGWAVENLLKAGFDSYWPRYTVKVRGRPMAEKYRSVFPGYMFAQFDCDIDPWRAICSTRGIRRVLGAKEDGVIALPAGFVETMMADAPSGIIEASEKETVMYKPGDQIKITDGPLAGHVGIMKYSEKGRVALLLSLLGRQNTVILPVDRVCYAGAPL